MATIAVIKGPWIFGLGERHEVLDSGFEVPGAPFCIGAAVHVLHGHMLLPRIEGIVIDPFFGMWKGSFHEEWQLTVGDRDLLMGMLASSDCP